MKRDWIRPQPYKGNAGMIKGLGRQSQNKNPISQPGAVDERGVRPLSVLLNEGPLPCPRPGASRIKHNCHRVNTPICFLYPATHE